MLSPWLQFYIMLQQLEMYLMILMDDHRMFEVVTFGARLLDTVSVEVVWLVVVITSGAIQSLEGCIL